MGVGGRTRQHKGSSTHHTIYLRDHRKTSHSAFPLACVGVCVCWWVSGPHASALQPDASLRGILTSWTQTNEPAMRRDTVHKSRVQSRIATYFSARPDQGTRRNPPANTRFPHNSNVIKRGGRKIHEFFAFLRLHGALLFLCVVL